MASTDLAEERFVRTLIRLPGRCRERSISGNAVQPGSMTPDVIRTRLTAHWREASSKRGATRIRTNQKARTLACTRWLPHPQEERMCVSLSGSSLDGGLRTFWAGCGGSSPGEAKGMTFGEPLAATPRPVDGTMTFERIQEGNSHMGDTGCPCRIGAVESRGRPYAPRRIPDRVH